MARQPINMMEQEGVPGRVDLGPALGNLFRQAPSAVGDYIKQNAMFGAFADKDPNAPSPAERYAQMREALKSGSGKGLTPEQQEEIAMRTMDAITPIPATVIGLKSVQGQNLMKFMDMLVPGSREAFENAFKIRRAIRSGDHVPQSVLDKLDEYDELITKVYQHPQGSKVMASSGFSPEDVRDGVFTKYVGDETTAFKPGMEPLLRGKRKSYVAKEDEVTPFKGGVNDVLLDSVLQREYPELAQRTTMEFKDLGSPGRRGSMDAHYLGEDPNKIAEGTYNLVTDKQPTIPSDRWADNILGTVVHEQDHAIAGYEDMLGANFRMNTPTRTPLRKLYNMIREIPEEDIGDFGQTIQRLRMLSDLGLDSFEAGYKSLAHENTARASQRAFLGEGPGGKYTPEGFEVFPKAYFGAGGAAPEDLVVHPTLREFRALHEAAGDTSANPAGAGIGYLYDKLKLKK